MPNLAASQVSPFVGTRDFAVSRDFYVALGWQLLWDRGDLAQLELAGQRIFLQRHYQREWCENTMLHVTVADAAAWHEHAQRHEGSRHIEAGLHGQIDFVFGRASCRVRSRMMALTLVSLGRSSDFDSLTAMGHPTTSSTRASIA